MKVSVIVTTYSWPDALLLTLSALARQSHIPDEVIVADDGSGTETRRTLEHVARTFPTPLRHYWQEDAGFRVARCRNAAIASATGNYILLLDGDMVPHRNFVEDHLRHARPGSFVQGSRALTSPKLADYMLQHGVMDIGLLTPHLRRRRNTLRSNLLASMLLTLSRRGLRGIKTCNQGWYRTDLLRVNGFDERMLGWGREDAELALRTSNAGTEPRHLRFSALAWHLYHLERHMDGSSANDEYLRETRVDRKTWAQLGLCQHPRQDEHSPPSLPDLRELALRAR